VHCSNDAFYPGLPEDVASEEPEVRDSDVFMSKDQSNAAAPARRVMQRPGSTFNSTTYFRFKLIKECCWLQLFWARPECVRARACARVCVSVLRILWGHTFVGTVTLWGLVPFGDNMKVSTT